jgi:hypothetical protein
MKVAPYVAPLLQSGMYTLILFYADTKTTSFSLLSYLLRWILARGAAIGHLKTRSNSKPLISMLKFAFGLYKVSVTIIMAFHDFPLSLYCTKTDFLPVFPRFI